MKDRLYFGDLFADFASGVQLDIRAKFACELAKAAMTGAWADQPEVAAEACSNVAASLFADFEERGWLKELPPDNQLPMDVRKHLERMVRAQALQGATVPQMTGEEAPKVETAVRGQFNPRKQ
jgi:hypothetical protein